MEDVRTIPSDVLLLVMERLCALDLLNLGCTCKRFQELVSREMVWKKYFDPRDLWAMNEYANRKTWREVYRAWVRESYWLYKASRYSEWPSLLGRARTISASCCGNLELAGALTEVLADSLYPSNPIPTERHFKRQLSMNAFSCTLRDAYNNAFPFDFLVKPWHAQYTGLSGRVAVLLCNIDKESYYDEFRTLPHTRLGRIPESIIVVCIRRRSEEEEEESALRMQKFQREYLAAHTSRETITHLPTRWVLVDLSSTNDVQELRELLMCAVAQGPRRMLTEEEFRDRFRKQRQDLP